MNSNRWNWIAAGCALGLCLSAAGCATELAGDLAAPAMPGRAASVMSDNSVMTDKGVSLQARSYCPAFSPSWRVLTLEPAQTTELESCRETITLDDRPVRSAFLRFDLGQIPRGARVQEAYLSMDYRVSSSLSWSSAFDLLVYNIQNGPVATQARQSNTSTRYGRIRDFTVSETRPATGDRDFWYSLKAKHGRSVRPVDMALYRVKGMVGKQYHIVVQEANQFMAARCQVVRDDTPVNVNITPFVVAEAAGDRSITLCLFTRAGGTVTYSNCRLVVGYSGPTPPQASVHRPSAPTQNAADDVVKKLKTLRSLREQELISEEAYQRKRKQLIEKL